MAIAGVAVTLSDKQHFAAVLQKLKNFREISVEGESEASIAIVLEAETLEKLENIAENIRQWQEVLEVQIGYVNWEEI